MPTENTRKRVPKNNVKFSITLSEEQKQAKAQILEHPFNFVLGKAGSGKAQPLDSKILTPEGWKNMGELKIGDRVIGDDGLPKSVLSIFPQGNKDVYKVTMSDGFSTECCLDHLWNVMSRTNKHTKYLRNGNPNNKYNKFETKSLEEILKDYNQNTKKNKYFIPLVKPVNFDKKELPIHPYLMGCLIGDGSYSITYSHQISFSTKDKEIIQELTPLLPNGMEFKFKGGKGNCDYDIVKIVKNNKPNPLHLLLEKLKIKGQKSNTKCIPNPYLFSSVDDRISLLQGLLDTDGWVDNGQPHFCTVSPTLKDDFVHLIQSLGGTAKVREVPTTHKLSYRISLNLPSNIKCFRLERKNRLVTNKRDPYRTISNIELIGRKKTQCILINSDSHLYVTDSFIVTHNTLLACQIALDQFFKRQTNKIVITRPTVATEDNGFLPGSEAEKMEPWLVPIRSNMRKVYNKPDILTKMETEESIELVSLTHFRGRTFDNCVCIVDEFQNLTKQQLAMVIGRLGKGSTMIFCGDIVQCDLKFKNDSAIHEVPKLRGSKYVYEVKLKDNHRHEALDEVLNLLNNI